MMSVIRTTFGLVHNVIRKYPGARDLYRENDVDKVSCFVSLYLLNTLNVNIIAFPKSTIDSTAINMQKYRHGSRKCSTLRRKQ